MEYVDRIPDLGSDKKSVVTLGKFEGVHRGHQKLIRRVRELGEDNHWTKVAVAFHLNGARLLTKEQRIELIAAQQMDFLVEIPLTQEFMSKRPEEFVREYLVEGLHTACVVVGPDYRFGYQREGDTQLLKKLGEQYGFSVEVLEKERDGMREISSTYIKEELHRGNIPKVNELLGYRFSTSGEVLHGRGLGHKIGVPTTNLIPPKEKLMPPNGVYKTRSFFEGRQFWGITNVGYKPTVGGEPFLGVETYLYDCDEDLYGEQLRVEFYRYMRPEKKFASIQELIRQLKTDMEEGREKE